MMFLMGLLCLVSGYEGFSQRCFSVSYDKNGNRNSFKLVNCDKEWRGNECASLDIDEEKYDDLQVYPNPNNGRFSVELGNEEEKASAEVFVYDSKGVQIYRREFVGKIDVDISDSPSGGYLLRIIRDDAKRSVFVVKL